MVFSNAKGFSSEMHEAVTDGVGTDGRSSMATVW